MKASETKINSTALHVLKKANEPFFNKRGNESFFSKRNDFKNSFFNAAIIQPKLTIGQPNDQYEKEADSMADKAVQRLSDNKPGIALKNENFLQTKPIVPLANFTPFIQAKCASCEQEDKLQKKEEVDERDLLKDKLQKKSLFEGNPDDDKNIQRKCADCNEEKKLQKKPIDKVIHHNSDGIIQRKPGERKAETKSSQIKTTISMHVPKDDPAPDYSLGMKKLDAWELALFKIAPRLYGVVSTMKKGDLDYSYVDAINWEFTQSDFFYFIAGEILRGANGRLDVDEIPGVTNPLDKETKTMFMQIHQRIKIHAKEHFVRYRKVIADQTTDLPAKFNTLPDQKTPSRLQDTDLRTYVDAYLNYLFEKLNYALWKTTCDWEKKDYPNLLKGIRNISAMFIADCDKNQPAVSQEPVMPIVVSPDKQKQDAPKAQPEPKGKIQKKSILNSNEINSIQPDISQRDFNHPAFFEKRNSDFFSGSTGKSFFHTVPVQTKLEVNESGDPDSYRDEKEADLMADKVIETSNTNSSSGSGNNPANFFNKTHSFLQRKCTSCKQDEKLQKKPGSTSQIASANIETTLSSSKGSGSPLSENIREEMENSFGSDFSHVRIHNDDSAVQMNENLNAQAFTHGSDIYFNSGKYNVESAPGKHLLAHELTHTIQQGNAFHKLQRKPQTEESTENCARKNGGDLLPGNVGIVEQINRDAELRETLGDERTNLEEQIRKDYDARKFVCEAGVSAMLALYYNRDFKNRINVTTARKYLQFHADYYSFKGIYKTNKAKETLVKKYNIFIEKGNKDWKPEEIALLTEALGKLSDSEIPLIRNYHFVRWTDRCRHLEAKDPDYSCDLEDYRICGYHETDVKTRTYTITMYDCMGGGMDDLLNPDYNVDPGAEYIVHEIGHAMEFARLRLATEKFYDAKKEYERIKKQAEAVPATAGKPPVQPGLAEAEKAMKNADALLDKDLANAPVEEFKKLIKGKKPLTEYSKKNDTEAFAEAFMLYKVAPEKLQKLNKKLFEWFDKGGFR